MDQKGRKVSIHARIAEQIEAIAQAICENRVPVAEQLILRALTAQLAQEEASPESLRTEQARKAAQEYADDQRAIAAKLRRKMN